MADQYRSEAAVKVRGKTACRVPECKRKATLTIASARGNSYVYVPVCKPHHDDPDDAVRDAVSSF